MMYLQKGGKFGMAKRVGWIILLSFLMLCGKKKTGAKFRRRRMCCEQIRCMISIVILESSVHGLRTVKCFITCRLSSHPFSFPRPLSHFLRRRTTWFCRGAVPDNRPGEQQSLLGRCLNIEMLQDKVCIAQWIFHEDITVSFLPGPSGGSPIYLDRGRRGGGGGGV